jgi:hypothetical protein
MAKDLSGSEVAVDKQFIEIFQDLTKDRKTIEKAWDKLNTEIDAEIEGLQVVFREEIEELSKKMMEIQKDFHPYIQEINEKFRPKMRSCKREDQRLKLDFEEAWDNFFNAHPWYKGRSLMFDGKESLFRFDDKEGINYNNVSGLGGTLDQLDSFLRAQGFQIKPLDEGDKQKDFDELEF